jgi:hypothetical protein
MVHSFPVAFVVINFAFSPSYATAGPSFERKKSQLSRPIVIGVMRQSGMARRAVRRFLAKTDGSGRPPA